jgi:tRNA(adenine34) deaminase
MGITDGSSEDRQFMAKALELAEQAAAAGEVPVGAVLVLAGEVIAKASNAPIAGHDPTGHAEVLALRKAGEELDNYRLPNTTLYVTLEPCAMCAGALVHARVERLVFGAPDPQRGAAGSALDLLNHAAMNHRVTVLGGVMAEECGGLLRDFFQARR